MKNVVILGSTGSIGTQTLNVIRRNPDKFNVLALVANSSAELLSAQANEFKPKYVGLVSESAVSGLKLDYKCEISCGKSVLRDFAALPECDTVVCAVVGMSGFDGVLSAINAKKEVALANKEVLVAGGEYVMNVARAKDISILPVDSEHSAVWQCLSGKNKADVKQIILTASGGPFRNASCIDELRGVTVEQAVAHPNWKMGKKISVDSATMMNKGLEIIEARWLFDITDIDYVIHPQSIIHSMIKFKDGSVLAQMSVPNMELPIQLAIGYPERISCEQFDFGFDKELTFIKPREDVFILPRIAKESLAVGLSAPCTVNAANEAAVALFLNGKIGFTDIPRIVSSVFESGNYSRFNGYEDIISTHESTMERVFADYKNFLR